MNNGKGKPGLRIYWWDRILNWIFIALIIYITGWLLLDLLAQYPDAWIVSRARRGMEHFVAVSCTVTAILGSWLFVGGISWPIFLDLLSTRKALRNEVLYSNRTAADDRLFWFTVKLVLPSLLLYAMMKFITFEPPSLAEITRVDKMGPYFPAVHEWAQKLSQLFLPPAPKQGL